MSSSRRSFLAIVCAMLPAWMVGGKSAMCNPPLRAEFFAEGGGYRPSILVDSEAAGDFFPTRSPVTGEICLVYITQSELAKKPQLGVDADLRWTWANADLPSETKE